MEHVWKPRPTSQHWIELQGSKDALVRIDPMPNGKFLWQFRKFVAYAKSADEAKANVEAGAEFFDTFRRNPYT